MKAHGISGKVLTWIGNWLKDRKQRTKLNDSFSKWDDVISGVPQGSILGPLAFLIYINDIDDETALISIIKKFADDTKVGNTINAPEDAQCLQTTLNRLVDWSNKWGMQFNFAKCKVLHLGRTNPRYDYTMGGTQVAKTEEEKDIRVLVHDSLRPSRQCEAAARRANCILTQISKSFHYRTRKGFLKLYIQYVRPHLEFSVQAWCPWTARDTQELERVQKRAVSMISGLRGTNYEEKLKELGLESLEDRRTKLDLVQTYKILHGFDKVDSKVWFTTYGETQNRLTRASNFPLNLVRSRVSRLEVRQNFFSQRVIGLWNSLPVDVKNSKTVNTFKSNYDIFKGTSRGSADQSTPGTRE